VDEPDRSTIWPYKDGEPGDFYYSRYAHPAGVSAERALGELEGGDALLYSSGMAATSTVVLALAQPGTTIALAEGAYFGTSRLFDELRRWGLRYVEYDQRTAPPDADIVWIEAPANPVLTMPDFAAATGTRALTVCDATVATPVYLQALDRGVDIVVHSATKFLTGHHNALLGATVTRDPALTARLRALRSNTGPTASPDAAAALLEGLGTLDERLRRQTESATELAARLDAHPAVHKVRYPGFSGLISFDVAPGDAARRVETSTRLITNATSLGSVDSTMESRHRWEGDRIPEGLLRLSVGLEDPEAIWADLERALASL
jgi:cystathionine gamma-synthase